MVKVNVTCYKEICKKEFCFDTENAREEIYKVEGIPRIFIYPCPYCGAQNKVIIQY